MGGEIVKNLQSEAPYYSVPLQEIFQDSALYGVRKDNFASKFSTATTCLLHKKRTYHFKTVGRTCYCLHFHPNQCLSSSTTRVYHCESKFSKSSRVSFQRRVFKNDQVGGNGADFAKYFRGSQEVSRPHLFVLKTIYKVTEAQAKTCIRLLLLLLPSRGTLPPCPPKSRQCFPSMRVNIRMFQITIFLLL